MLHLVNSLSDSERTFISCAQALSFLFLQKFPIRLYGREIVEEHSRPLISLWS